MKSPRFDIDLDKHYKATVVIACPACGHENRHHLASLQPDSTLACVCGSDISLTATACKAPMTKPLPSRRLTTSTPPEHCFGKITLL